MPLAAFFWLRRARRVAAAATYPKSAQCRAKHARTKFCSRSADRCKNGGLDRRLQEVGRLRGQRRRRNNNKRRARRHAARAARDARDGGRRLFERSHPRRRAAVPRVWGRQGLRGHAAQGGAGAGLIGLSQRVRGRQGRAPSVHRGALRCSRLRFGEGAATKGLDAGISTKGRRGPCRVDGGHSRDVAEVAEGVPR